MAVISGVGGSVTIGGTPVASLNVWTISAKGNTAKTTVFGTTGQWETEIATVRGWTAKADGYLNDTDTAGQVALINGLNSTVTVAFLTGDSTHNWTGSAIVTGIDPKADVSSVETIAFSFNGTGALTFS